MQVSWQAQNANHCAIDVYAYHGTLWMLLWRKLKNNNTDTAILCIISHKKLPKMHWLVGLFMHLVNAAVQMLNAT